MLSFRLAVMWSLLLSATACGGGASSPPISPSPTPTPTPSPGGATSVVVIPRSAEFLGSDAFMPRELTVQAGTRVTWLNSDRDAHATTSDATGWNSDDISPGAQFSVAFPTPGTYPYHCRLHPSMTGTVVVEAAANSAGVSGETRR